MYQTTDPDKINQITSQDGKTYSKEQLINTVLNKYSFNELPIKLQNARFTELHEKFVEIKEKLYKWDYNNPCICSFISNKNGIGKSYLSVCLYKKFIKNFIENKFNLEDLRNKISGIYDFNYAYDLYSQEVRPKVLYIAERNILLRIRDSYDNKQETESEILNDYAKYDLLVIDDMFATKHNDFASSMMYSIIDERSEWRGKTTIINSNFSAEEIRKINSRIESRINNEMMFEFVSDKFKDLRK